MHALLLILLPTATTLFGIVTSVHSDRQTRIKVSVNLGRALRLAGKEPEISFLLWLNEANSRGWMLERMVKLVIKDDHSNPAEPAMG